MDLGLAFGLVWAVAFLAGALCEYLIFGRPAPRNRRRP